MRFMPAPKILLFLGFLSVMGPALSAPFDPGVAYRFGEWTLARAKNAPQPTALSPLLYRVSPAAGQFEEIFLYHGDGDQRGLALRFGSEPKDDRAVLMTGSFSQNINGCRQGMPARLPELKKVLGSSAAVKAERTELPDDIVLRVGDADRGLRRVGDQLVADFGHFRVRIVTDTTNVHVGEHESGDFCRFEVDEDEKKGRDRD